MKRSLLTASCLIAAATVSAQEPEEELQDVPYVFESRVDMVSVPVAVLDRAGEYVTGLSAESFVVRENGEEQESARRCGRK